jgi:hypothetical protein
VEPVFCLEVKCQLGKLLQQNIAARHIQVAVMARRIITALNAWADYYGVQAHCRPQGGQAWSSLRAGHATYQIGGHARNRLNLIGRVFLDLLGQQAKTRRPSLHELGIVQSVGDDDESSPKPKRDRFRGEVRREGQPDCEAVRRGSITITLQPRRFVKLPLPGERNVVVAVRPHNTRQRLLGVKTIDRCRAEREL